MLLGLCQVPHSDKLCGLHAAEIVRMPPPDRQVEAGQEFVVPDDQSATVSKDSQASAC